MLKPPTPPLKNSFHLVFPIIIRVVPSASSTQSCRKGVCLWHFSFCGHCQNICAWLYCFKGRVLKVSSTMSLQAVYASQVHDPATSVGSRSELLANVTLFGWGKKKWMKRGGGKVIKC